jgi:protein-S-isoprenylcysteine O-methyltransferase Ste14
MTSNFNWAKIAKRIRVPLGFAFAILYLWLSRPTPTSILIGLGFVILGVFVRAIASGHVQKNEQLAISGPYAYTRNPLYLGSLILAIGFAVTGRNLWIGSGIVIFFLAIYLPVIRAEEEFLRPRFAEFAEYARHVPRLLPRLTPFGSSRSSFSSQLYWKHREYNAAVGACAIMMILVAKMLWLPK